MMQVFCKPNINMQFDVICSESTRQADKYIFISQIFFLSILFFSFLFTHMHAHMLNIIINVKWFEDAGFEELQKKKIF